jgi:error-prone DNA polymerase
MVTPFLMARNGWNAAVYPHPDLEFALEETAGVVVFHEQVLQIVARMTGVSLAEADEVRRALGEKDAHPEVRAWFVPRAIDAGYPVEVAERVWEVLAAFGSFGFCKAHAAAFALPTYQSAWLKAHHPAAFYAGLLTHDPGMYPKRLLLADARRRGVPVLPLDVNRSGVAHRIELVSEGEGRAGAWGLRLALSDVHGISEAEAGRIAAGQPYASLLDFWERARPSRPVAGRLAQVGALDAFGANRRDLQLHLTELHRGARGGGGGQLPLAGGRRTASAGLPDLSDEERLSAELGVLSMDASRHLMDDHRAFLDELRVLSARRLRDARHGETVLVAGAKAATQTPPIRSGRRVVFTTLDDGTGLVDLAFFEDSHDTCAHTVFHSWLLLVRGVVQRRGPRSLSVVGAAAWNLAELLEIRRREGLEGVAARLAETGTAGDGDGRDGGTGGRVRAGAVAGSDGLPRPAGSAAPDPMERRRRELERAEEAKGEQGGDDDRGDGRGRRIRMPTGYEMHPWADLRPAGEGPPGGRKLWHQSPGSAG